jgi:hypothetical protein
MPTNDDNGLTTIQVKRGSVEILNSLKIHPKQPIYEVIESLLKEKTGDADGNNEQSV